VAAAGKEIYPLPMVVNAALRDPLAPPPACQYESGGPTDNVLGLWKVAAPAIDVLAPDVYLRDSARYRRVCELYSRPDNPLFIPETGNAGEFARHFFTALGYGAVGWAPFGIDCTVHDDLGALAPFALNYRIVGPMMRELARLGFEGRLRATAEREGAPVDLLDFGRWQALITYGAPRFGLATEAKGNPEPIGRVLVAELGEDVFLVAGAYCRVDFQPAAGTDRQREFVRVVEGCYVDDAFTPRRLLNGDQTDWGLNLRAATEVLRVTLGTF
jgi:hypothetical protein